MGTIGNSNLTWADLARRHADGKIDTIIEQMNKVNEIMTDMVVRPGNTDTGMKTTIRSGLPSVAWRQINKGVVPSKSATKQIEFAAGVVEGLSKIDELLIDIEQDKAGARLSEAAPFIESIGQTLASTTIYGDSRLNPERFTGLASYYSDPTAESGVNMVNGGGSGSDNTSIYLVGWGERTIHGFYPKASKAGIEHEDLGKQLTSDGAGGEYRAYVDLFRARLGMAVRDWRFGARLCNLDVSDLATAGAGTDNSANLLRLMIQLKNKLPTLQGIKPAFYCNREVFTALEIQAINKGNVQLSLSDLANGTSVLKFLGIPVRRVDAILNTESAISFS